MKKQTAIPALLICLALMISVFAGCGSSSAAASEAESTAAVSAAEEAASAPEAEAEPEEAPAEEAAPASADEEAAPAEAEASVEEEDVPEAVEISDTEIIRTYTEAEPMPLVDEPVTLTAWDYVVPPVMAVIEDYGTDGQVYAELQKRTGVTLEFTTANLLTASDSMSLMIAANDLPDMIFDFGMFCNTAYDDLIDGDIIVNYKDYESVMPNYFDILDNNPAIARDVYTLSGNVPLACNIQSGLQVSGGPAIRQDWLDADGLETPVTVDDLHEVLLAFQNQNDCQYPLWVSSVGGCSLNIAYNIAFDAGAASTVGGFIYRDGAVEYCVPTDDFRAYVQNMADWYAEGLISPDFVSQTYNNNATDDELVGNACGFFSTSVNGITNLSGYEPEADVEPVRPVVLNEGDKVLFDDAGTSWVSKGGAAVACSCPDIELACRIIDYFYSEDGIILANYGVEGVSFEYNADGEPELTELVTNNPDGYAFALALIKYTSSTPCSICINERNYLGYTDAQMLAIDVWMRDGTTLAVPGASWDADDETEYSTINNDVGSFVSTNVLQFIIGERSMDDWDSFIADVENNFDIERMTELYQNAVDVYMSIGT